MLVLLFFLLATACHAQVYMASFNFPVNYVTGTVPYPTKDKTHTYFFDLPDTPKITNFMLDSPCAAIYNNLNLPPGFYQVSYWLKTDKSDYARGATGADIWSKNYTNQRLAPHGSKFGGNTAIFVTKENWYDSVFEIAPGYPDNSQFVIRFTTQPAPATQPPPPSTQEDVQGSQIDFVSFGIASLALVMVIVQVATAYCWSNEKDLQVASAV
jgi:hypothetical protein